MLICKSRSELAAMRQAGRMVAETHRLLARAIRPGIATAELDRIADRYIRSRQSVPSFRGYNDFPASICTSVNEQRVHGTRLYTISHAIQKVVESAGFSVVQDAN